jgi:acylphosphatase
MTDDIHRRVIVTGRVQGVGYRAWAIRAATELGLRGWVRNRPDGTVEALAMGPAPAVEAFVAACRRGPAAARVTAVETEPALDDDSAGFAWRRERDSLAP